MTQKKHKTLVSCPNDGGNLAGIFRSSSHGSEKVDGYACCEECKKIFSITVKELNENE